MELEDINLNLMCTVNKCVILHVPGVEVRVVGVVGASVVSEKQLSHIYIKWMYKIDINTEI